MQNNQIGLFLKKLRIENKLTQKELADILEITPQTISKWEVNGSFPDLDMLVTLSEIYKISIDEIIKCKKQKSKHITTFKKYIGELSVEHKIVLILYSLLLIIATILPFINFIDSPIGFVFYPRLTVWWIITILILLPILLLSAFLIDKKKTSNVIISMFAIITIMIFTIMILANPLFISVKIGMLLLMLYMIILFISSILILIPIEKPIFNYKLITKEQVTTILLLFVVALPLPFFYTHNGSYRFNETDQFIYILTLLLPLFILLKYVKIIPNKFVINISLIITCILFYMTFVYIFNGCRLIPSIFIYTYIIILADDMKKSPNMKNITFKNLMPINIIVVDSLSILTYLRLFTNDGDIFRISSKIYFINDLGCGPFLYLNLILLLIAIVFRMMKYKHISQIMYIVWGLWLAFFTTIICFKYIFVQGSYFSDGMYFLIPPLLLIVFILSYIPNYINIKKNRKCTSNIY